MAVNVTTTGAVVPNVNDGITTSVFVALMMNRPINPGGAFTGSIVTDPGPGVIDENCDAPAPIPVTVSDGVHVDGVGDAVGVGDGDGDGDGVGDAVGDGDGEGVGEGEGVGVGVGVAPLHWARISTQLELLPALNVTSTGRPDVTTVKSAVTGSYVPCGNDGIVTNAFVEFTTSKIRNPRPKF